MLFHLCPLAYVHTNKESNLFDCLVMPRYFQPWQHSHLPCCGLGVIEKPSMKNGAPITKRDGLNYYNSPFNNIKMNSSTSKFLFQNVWITSYDHHESNPKHHYIIASLNSVGFQVFELFDFNILSMNKSSWSFYLSQNPLTTTRATYTYNTHYTIGQKYVGYFSYSFNILISS